MLIAAAFFFEIARGSALECAAVQDCLEACKVIGVEENSQGKKMLLRIVSMLTRLAQHRHEVREEAMSYSEYDYDNDNDSEVKEFPKELGYE